MEDKIETREFEKDGETWLEVKYVETIAYKQILPPKARELYNTQKRTRDKINKSCRDSVIYDMGKEVFKELDETIKTDEKLSAPFNRWTFNQAVTPGRPLMIINLDDVGLIVDLKRKNEEE